MASLNHPQPQLQRQLRTQVSEALPAGLTGSRSILLLRRVARPGSTAVKADQPAAPQNLVWRRELRREIERQQQLAVRPLSGQVPSEAPAIWFEDGDEALACLWLWCSQGQPALPWWGRSLLNYWGVSSSRLAVWMASQSQNLPHAVKRLERWKAVRPALAALSPADARGLLICLIREWQVNWSPPASDFGQADPANQTNLAGDIFKEPEPQSALQGPRDGNFFQTAMLTPAHAAFWFLSRSLAEHSHRISKERLDAVWAGIEPAFHGPRWNQPRNDEPGVELMDVPKSAAAPDRRQALQSSPADSVPPDHPPQDQPLPGSPASDSVHGTKSENQPDYRSQADLPDTGVSSAAGTKRGREAKTGVQERHPPEPAHQKASSKSRGLHREKKRPSSDGLSTRLGGIFYLVNVMLQLDLPGCFEESCALQSAVGPWEVLEGLGRTLLAGTGRRFVDDPVWGMLADLAGRPENAPAGSGLGRFDAAEMPVEWPAALPAVAVPFPDLAAAPLTSALPRPFAEWLAAAGPLVGRWLHARLNRIQPLLPDWHYVNLLAVSGRVWLTRTHLDVRLPLESISTRARLAGFDLNPGWQPVWGKVITFYFVPISQIDPR